MTRKPKTRPLPEPLPDLDGRPAPLAGCDCAVCVWARAWSREIRPTDPQFRALQDVADRWIEEEYRV